MDSHEKASPRASDIKQDHKVAGALYYFNPTMKPLYPLNHAYFRLRGHNLLNSISSSGPFFVYTSDHNRMMDES